MELLELLKNNKGTVSSALGKELALKVLNGDNALLKDAINYVNYDLENPKFKSIRAGAAKILEKVAEKKPELIAKDLKKLKPALNVKEPQTRWMLMQVFGYCAELNPKESESVVNFAKLYLSEKAGVCLSGAVHLYLGRLGATSEKMAYLALEILDDDLKSATENEANWILEAFIMIADKLGKDGKFILEKNALLYLDSKMKSMQNRAKKILKKVQTK